MLPPPPSSPLFPYTTLFRSPRVPQATGYRDGYVTGGPLCRPGRGGPAQPQEVPMARIGIQLMMLKDHIAEQGVTEVLSRVKETGFRVVEVSQIPMTEENVTAMAAAREIGRAHV